MKKNDELPCHREIDIPGEGLSVRTGLTKVSGMYVKLYCTQITVISSYFYTNCVIVLLFQTRTYIHLFEDCFQNWFRVVSIIKNTH